MKLLCAGDIAVDTIANVDEFPQVNTNAEIKAFIKSYGGSAANTAYIARQLGAEVGFISVVGPDFPQDYYTRFLEAGIDLTYLNRVRTNTTTVFIFSKKNDQISFFFRGASQYLDKLEIPPEYIKKYDIVHLCRNYPNFHRKISDICARSGVKVSFNPGYGIDEMDKVLLKEIINKTDILFVNEYEDRYLCQLFGFSNTSDIVEWAGLELLVITLGKKGSRLLYDGDDVIVPALEISIVDPTGAGDAFTAGFLRSYGDTGDPVEAAKIGSCVAALVIQHQTTQPAIDWDTVYNLRKKSYI